MSFKQSTPVIIAHRGASAYAPENTISAFELAIEHRADIIELDAKLTADEHIVVIHDAMVDRTTNGTGYVHELRLTELKQLDASHAFKSNFSGETIPTLDEVLNKIGNRIMINIELSNYRAPFNSLPEKVAQVIKSHGLENNLLISSFNPISLWRFHQLLPSIPVGILVTKGLLGTLSGSIIGGVIVSYQSIHPEKSLVNQKLVNKVHRSGRQIYPFTVNSASEIKRVLSLKVDGIITDDPLTARSIID